MYIMYIYMIYVYYVYIYMIYVYYVYIYMIYVYIGEKTFKVTFSTFINCMDVGLTAMRRFCAGSGRPRARRSYANGRRCR